jgi:hypothetical protein
MIDYGYKDSFEPNVICFNLRFNLRKSARNNTNLREILPKSLNPFRLIAHLLHFSSHRRVDL